MQPGDRKKVEVPTSIFNNVPPKATHTQIDVFQVEASSNMSKPSDRTLRAELQLCVSTISEPGNIFKWPQTEQQQKNCSLIFTSRPFKKYWLAVGVSTFSLPQVTSAWMSFFEWAICRSRGSKDKTNAKNRTNTVILKESFWAPSGVQNDRKRRFSRRFRVMSYDHKNVWNYPFFKYIGRFWDISINDFQVKAYHILGLLEMNVGYVFKIAEPP